MTEFQRAVERIASEFTAQLLELFGKASLADLAVFMDEEGAELALRTARNRSMKAEKVRAPSPAAETPKSAPERTEAPKSAPERSKNSERAPSGRAKSAGARTKAERAQPKAETAPKSAPDKSTPPPSEPPQDDVAPPSVPPPAPAPVTETVRVPEAAQSIDEIPRELRRTLDRILYVVRQRPMGMVAADIGRVLSLPETELSLTLGMALAAGDLDTRIQDADVFYVSAERPKSVRNRATRTTDDEEDEDDDGTSSVITDVETDTTARSSSSEIAAAED